MVCEVKESVNLSSSPLLSLSNVIVEKDEGVSCCIIWFGFDRRSESTLHGRDSAKPSLIGANFS